MKIRIKYYLIRYFEIFTHWCSFLKVCRHCYRGDWSSVLLVELHELERVKKYSKSNFRIDLCIRLLKIVLEIEVNRTYVNVKNRKRFWNIDDKTFFNPSILGINEYYLYLHKAWNLYCLIKKEYLFKWGM